MNKERQLEAEVNSEMAALSVAQQQRLLADLRRCGVIGDEAYRFAGERFLPPLQWRAWLLRLCLGLGTALLLAGVMFFLAYNWNAMPKWSKLALLEGAMVVCFAAAAIIGLQRLWGQCLLLSGTVFIGLFFAVFGQIYQTGADAWQLFALWSVLMLGFLWVSRFPVQWILQWSISGVALFLYLQQAFYWRHNEYWQLGLIMAIYVLVIWAGQVGLGKRSDWLNCAWLRVLTLFIVHAWLVISATVALFYDHLMVFFIAAIITAGLLWWHIDKRFDLLSQVVGTVALAVQIWVLALYFLSSYFTNHGWGIDFTPSTITTVMLTVTVGLSVGMYQAVLVLKKHNKGE